MTKQEQNDIIKQVWTEHLQRKDDLPADLADGYSIWLQALIKEAAPLLSPEQSAGNQSTGEQQQQGPAPGGEQPAA